MGLLAAAAGGLFLGLSQPSYDLWPLAFVALVPLLLTARDWVSGAVQGLVFGAVSFGFVLFWLTTLHVASWVMLSLVLATQWAVWGAAVGALAARATPFGVRLLVLPSLLTILEFVRDRFPWGGFAWAELGMSQHSVALTRSVAAIGGVAVITWLVCAVNVAVAGGLAAWRRRDGRVDRPTLAWAVVTVTAVGAVFLAAWAVRPTADAVGSIDVGSVQGNRFEGYDVSREQMFASHVALTETLPPGLDVVVWGESSLNGFDADAATGRRLVRASGGVPVVGNMALDGVEEGTFENTNVLFDEDGEPVEQYVKRHPVPFGEFVPFRDRLGFVSSLDRVPRDAVAGDEVGIFDVSGASLGTIICFESVFPDPARDTVREGAEAILLVTNNASYGRSDVSEQHLAHSRMRAVETHRAISVTAISGKSALIAPDGEILEKTQLWDPTVLDWAMPLQDDETAFVRFGNWVAPLSAVLMVLGLVWWWRRGSPREERPSDEVASTDGSVQP